MSRDDDQPSQSELTGREPALGGARRVFDPALCVAGLLDAAEAEERRRIIGVAAAAGQTAALTAALAQVVATFVEQTPAAVTVTQCSRAIDALRQLGSYDALPVLARAHHATDRAVQQAAARALRRICDALPGPLQPLRPDTVFLECVLRDMCPPLTYIAGYSDLIIHSLEELSQDDLVAMVNQIKRQYATLHGISEALRTASLALHRQAQHEEQPGSWLLADTVGSVLKQVGAAASRFAVNIPADLRACGGNLLDRAVQHCVARVSRNTPSGQVIPISARAWADKAVLTIGSDRPREPAQFPPPADEPWMAFWGGLGDVEIGAACMAMQACGGTVLLEAEGVIPRTISICLPLGSAAQPQEETRVS